MDKIILKDVSKSYRNNQVLKNINYEINTGQTYLLIGANGSGKSTLLKCLLGLIDYQGDIVYKANLKINYIPEFINFPEYISVYRFIKNIGEIKGIAPDALDKLINYNLYYWDLYDAKDKLIYQLSKGMRQKVLIIQASLDDGDLYIFDEPLNGLDYKNQKKFLGVVQELKSKNKTVILSTHYGEFYSRVIDKIISIRDGQLYEGIN